jgi:hypothetical protein
LCDAIRHDSLGSFTRQPGSSCTKQYESIKQLSQTASKPADLPASALSEGVAVVWRLFGGCVAVVWPSLIDNPGPRVRLALSFFGHPVKRCRLLIHSEHHAHKQTHAVYCGVMTLLPVICHQACQAASAR